MIFINVFLFSGPQFGSVLQLHTSAEFLKAVDEEQEKITIVVHLYRKVGVVLHLYHKVKVVVRLYCKVSVVMHLYI